ncbi:PcF and SCR74-like cys-rich secreted peptide, putative [Phytophthora infestans T30-4]|uniref:PcF and SCR74-like cys-rich secreted peptide, putative n=1 Tax=Phytophthora infestans (strain T30-4) TaxID=403677 RepID=D0NEI3_PHYIT|nr:PcF and SCR74-like cys-rich secreted peptide, putative [Phytophthora infestans T30-4]EEY56628.1 PcF and SCR74-like cys-rich secreted peptide, putative [Phytophthora infestans T30-4]|eukprot:XP_002902702.1 PcF and SCR74-like cys-rich secreted peptide, putative [Phytophthora infestans T30-4]
MNLGIYAVAAITAMIATTTSAQQLCSAPSCAYRYSESNTETSECCRKRSMDFNECCRQSCSLAPHAEVNAMDFGHVPASELVMLLTNGVRTLYHLALISFLRNKDDLALCPQSLNCANSNFIVPAICFIALI